MRPGAATIQRRRTVVILRQFPLDCLTVVRRSVLIPRGNFFSANIACCRDVAGYVLHWEPQISGKAGSFRSSLQERKCALLSWVWESWDDRWQPISPKRVTKSRCGIARLARMSKAHAAQHLRQTRRAELKWCGCASPTPKR